MAFHPAETSPTRTGLSCRSPSCPYRAFEAADNGSAAPGPAADPWDEVACQQAICGSALAIVDAARKALTDLAARSRDLRRHVSCDQEDWPAIIGDCLDDMVGDTFGCLPDAISRARRELASDDL